MSNYFHPTFPLRDFREIFWTDYIVQMNGEIENSHEGLLDLYYFQQQCNDVTVLPFTFHFFVANLQENIATIKVRTAKSQNIFQFWR